MFECVAGDLKFNVRNAPMRDVLTSVVGTETSGSLPV
jgi:hypothetical protein